MTIVLNGKQSPTGAKTLHDIITEKTLNPEHVVIEHNRSIIRRDQWEATAVTDGDAIEILSFVGGG